MNNKDNLLFDNFNSVSKQEWKAKATMDLKGADYDKKLVWKNLNQINLQSFYNYEDHEVYLENTGENSQSLINYRRIIVNKEKNANKLALKAISEGMNGLIFDLKENVSAYGLLEGIDLNTIAVSFILRNKEIEFVNEFLSFVNENDVSFDNLRGYFDLSVIHSYVTSGKIDCNQFDIVCEIISLTKNYPNHKSIFISGGIYLDSGANQVQEIAYTLSSLVYLIDKYSKRGIEVQTIFDNLHFEFAVGSEYFIEIGKFRAFNNLLHGIADKYGVREFTNSLSAKTSIWSKSVTDVNTNMLRATTEVMSAILGNVDGLEVDAFDKQYNDINDFSSRIAGNIATILMKESYFDKVTNPVDGSYYIEEISSKIAEKALELFKIIENNGGFFQSFESERIQKQIAEIRFEKIKMLSKRKLTIVGVNKFPNLTEAVNPDILSEMRMGTKSINKILKPRRAALEIEAIRRNTEELVAKTKHRPVVELTSYGNLAMSKARAAFAHDFMGVSGFIILDEQSHCCAKKAVEESSKSESDIVIICSSDNDYAETAIDFVKLFRTMNNDKVLLLAGNPSDIADKLLNEGLDGFINIKSDVIDTISSIQNKIQKQVASM